MRLRLDEIVFDCDRPAALVRFWSGLLGGDPVDRHEGWCWVEPPGFPRLAFQAVPEPRVAKNRVHVDVEVDPADLDAAIAKAVGLGATRIGEVVADHEGSYQVMTDPEGNEFCFVHL